MPSRSYATSMYPIVQDLAPDSGSIEHRAMTVDNEKDSRRNSKNQALRRRHKHPRQKKPGTKSGREENLKKMECVYFLSTNNFNERVFGVAIVLRGIR